MSRIPFRFFGVMILLASTAAAQDPLAPIRPSGLSVTPAFEGWYKNPDGTYSISFGYLNRNGKETLEIPVGPDNNIAPGNPNQGQPTHFEPRRNWGVFTVIVPADFGKKKITWNLNNRGEHYVISGSLDPLWQIDALEGEAGSDNTPPVLKLAENGPEGRGPGGVTAGPVEAKVGAPVSLQVWSRDDGHMAAAATTSTRDVPVTLTWLKHQGPGDIPSTPSAARVPNAGGSTITSAVFSPPVSP